MYRDRVFQPLCFTDGGVPEKLKAFPRSDNELLVVLGLEPSCLYSVFFFSITFDLIPEPRLQ